MGGSNDTVGMPDVRSRRSFFRLEIVCQDQPLGMKPEPTLARVKANGVKRISGSKVSLLKRFGFESQLSKFL